MAKTMSRVVTETGDYGIPSARRRESAITRYLDALPEQERRGIVGIIVSTTAHAAVLLIFSIWWMATDNEPSFETVATIDTALPEAAVLIEPEVLQMEPDAVEAVAFEELPDVGAFAAEEPTINLPDVAAGEDPAPIPNPGVPQRIAADVARIQKRVAQEGGKTGEVQFSLSWRDMNDADLHVVVPEGRRIFYGWRSADLGKLDVDMNVKPESKRPVENVRWLKRAPMGRYTVVVHWFHSHVYARGIPFQLMSKLGADTQLHKDTLPYPGAIKVYRFRYIPPNITGERRKLIDMRLRKLQEDEEETASKLLEDATAGGQRNLGILSRIIVRYPHTDAALQAMNLIGGKATK